jgi:hypothetical protein
MLVVAPADRFDLVPDGRDGGAGSDPGISTGELVETALDLLIDAVCGAWSVDRRHDRLWISQVRPANADQAAVSDARMAAD